MQTATATGRYRLLDFGIPESHHFPSGVLKARMRHTERKWEMAGLFATESSRQYVIRPNAARPRRHRSRCVTASPSTGLAGVVTMDYSDYMSVARCRCVPDKRQPVQNIEILRRQSFIWQRETFSAGRWVALCDVSRLFATYQYMPFIFDDLDPY